MVIIHTEKIQGIKVMNILRYGVIKGLIQLIW